MKKIITCPILMACKASQLGPAPHPMAEVRKTNATKNDGRAIVVLAPESAQSNLYSAKKSRITMDYESAKIWIPVRGVRRDSLSMEEIAISFARLEDCHPLKYAAIRISPTRTKQIGVRGSSKGYEHYIQLWTRIPAPSYSGVGSFEC